MAIASQKVYDFESLLIVGLNINKLTHHKSRTHMMQIKEEEFLCAIWKIIIYLLILEVFDFIFPK